MLARFLLSLLLASTAPAHAQPLSAEVERDIARMVERCSGDRTCEAVVHKRETRAAMQRIERAALKQDDPLAYYLSLWGRSLAFIVGVAGAATLYVFIMRRLFGRKR